MACRLTKVDEKPAGAMILTLRKRHRLSWTLLLPAILLLFYLALSVQEMEPQQQTAKSVSTQKQEVLIQKALPEIEAYVEVYFTNREQYLMIRQKKSLPYPVAVLYAYTQGQSAGLLVASTGQVGEYHYPLSLPGPLHKLVWVNPLNKQTIYEILL